MKHFVMWVTGLSSAWMIGAAVIQMSSIGYLRSPGSLMMNVIWGILNGLAFVATVAGWHTKPIPYEHG